MDYFQVYRLELLQAMVVRSFSLARRDFHSHLKLATMMAMVMMEHLSKVHRRSLRELASDEKSRREFHWLFEDHTLKRAGKLVIYLPASQLINYILIAYMKEYESPCATSLK